MTDPRATQAIVDLKEIQEKYADDVEAAHGFADDVMVKLLIQLGYDDVVREWNKIEKWYA